MSIDPKVLTVITLLLLTSCSPVASTTALPTLEAIDSGSPCGNNVCEGPETVNNCPADCAAEPIVAENPTEERSPSVDEDPVLYFGIMVHLEGWDDDLDQGAYRRHVELVREYADLFERYGAVLTLESRELTDGSLRWGDNVLLEMQQRGHGVGVHADIGGQRNYDCSQFAADLQAEREQLEALGVEVAHVSGTVSHCDWVTAALDAGYSFTSGNVAYALMSLPESQRPAEYRNCPNPAACHQAYPEELAERLSPYRAADGATWTTPIAEGGLVIIPSSGGLACFEEEQASAESRTGCEFAQADIDASIAELEEAIALVEPGRVNTYYLSWSLGQPLNPTLLEEWLTAVQSYVDAGQVEWVSLVEMYDLYETQ